MLNMIIAGFGGQGILFAGKIIAHAGLMLGKEVSWLPSYGPEMRGGTANVCVCIDEEEISSPLITEPETLIAMNLPSYNKFLDTVKPNGLLIYDSSLIHQPSMRDDIDIFGIPATSIAKDNDLQGLANLVIVGYTLKKQGFATVNDIVKALEKNIPESKMYLLEKNIKALNLGYSY